MLGLNHAFLHLELGFKLKVFQVSLMVIDFLLVLFQLDWAAMFVTRVNILIHLQILKTKFIFINPICVLDHTIEQQVLEYFRVDLLLFWGTDLI